MAVGCDPARGDTDDDPIVEEAQESNVVDALVGPWLARTNRERYVFTRAADGALNWYHFALTACARDDFGVVAGCTPRAQLDRSGTFAVRNGARTSGGDIRFNLVLTDASTGEVTLGARVREVRTTASDATVGPNRTPLSPTTQRRWLLALVDPRASAAPTMGFRRVAGDSFCAGDNPTELSVMCRNQVATAPAARGEWQCSARNTCAFVEADDNAAQRGRLTGVWSGGRSDASGHAAPVRLDFAAGQAGAGVTIGEGSNCSATGSCTMRSSTGTYRVGVSTVVISVGGQSSVYEYRVDGEGADALLTLLPVSSGAALGAVYRRGS
jgi:hypothetical protein